MFAAFGRGADVKTSGLGRENILSILWPERIVRYGLDTDLLMDVHGTAGNLLAKAKESVLISAKQVIDAGEV